MIIYSLKSVKPSNQIQKKWSKQGIIYKYIILILILQTMKKTLKLAIAVVMMIGLFAGTTMAQTTIGEGLGALAGLLSLRERLVRDLSALGRL